VQDGEVKYKKVRKIDYNDTDVIDKGQVDKRSRVSATEAQALSEASVRNMLGQP
jgi:hypothetical protein